jgi:hypothetical protein
VPPQVKVEYEAFSYQYFFAQSLTVLKEDGISYSFWVQIIVISPFIESG